MSAPSVSRCRVLKKGMHGDDVIALKRALSRWNPVVYPWPKDGFTDFFGEYLENALVEFKRRNIGEVKNILPIYGGTVHDVLRRKHRRVGGKTTDEWAYDATAIKLAKDFCKDFLISPEERRRNAIVAAGFYWYSHRSGIAYSQYRPFQLGKPPWTPTRWDCSAFVTACHFAGGAPDPNGRGYDHMGYTGTLIGHGREVDSVNQLKLGDLIFYGFSRSRPGFPSGAPTHVAMYVGLRDGQHMVLSHGSYPMRYYNYRYRSDINQFRTYSVA